MGIARAHGQAGEAMAAAYFELIGCAVMARNARLDGVEVDLVIEDGPAQVVVEVKTRARQDYGGAALAIDHVKRARLMRAAGALLRRGAHTVRIDVLAVDVVADGAHVRHYRNAVSG